MKLLLTAFEPFGGETINAALEASRAMPDRIEEIEIEKITVPTTFTGCLKPVLEAIGQVQPDCVLMLGQAAGRGMLTPERRAVNRIEARIPDNDGLQPQDQPVIPEGPEFYESTLPIEAMTEAIRRAGIPAEISASAGSFVCNALFYGVLHALSETKQKIPAGFLHVPVTPEQAELREKPTPSLPLADIVRGLTAAIRSLDCVKP